MEDSDSHVQIPGVEKLAPSPDERTSEVLRQRTSDMHLKEGLTTILKPTSVPG